MNTQSHPLKQEILQAMEERILTENRLLSKEKLARSAGLYYSVLTAVSAVMGLVYATRNFHALSALLSIGTVLLMMYLCVQKYALRAQKIRSECAVLRRLAYEAENADEAKRASVQTQWLEMSASVDGMSAQERRTLMYQCDRKNRETAEYIPQLYGYEKFLYWFEEITEIVVKVLIFLIPMICFVLTAVGVL